MRRLCYQACCLLVGEGTGGLYKVKVKHSPLLEICIAAAGFAFQDSISDQRRSIYKMEKSAYYVTSQKARAVFIYDMYFEERKVLSAALECRSVFVQWAANVVSPMFPPEPCPAVQTSQLHLIPCECLQMKGVCRQNLLRMRLATRLCMKPFSRQLTTCAVTTDRDFGRGCKILSMPPQPVGQGDHRDWREGANRWLRCR